MHSFLPPRTELKRILVYFGGADLFNVSSKVISILSSHEFKLLAIDVVIGSQSEHQQEVRQLADKRPHTNVYSNIQTLAGLIARADLCIGAGGSTTWERACLGLPTITIPIAENQVLPSTILSAEIDSPLLQADFLDSDLTEKVLTFMKSPESLSALSLRLSQLLDGSGISKLLNTITSSND